VWAIAELCGEWDALPFAGGLLEQPFGIMVLGAQLRKYAKAFAMYEQDREHTPRAARDMILLTAKRSAEMRRTDG
jgi:hypothetical protein